MMLNSLTVDVEDWYHVCGLPRIPAISPEDRRVAIGTRMVLDLLEKFSARGTFFVLGSVAEENPDLVPAIAAAGHEIASHGWSHRTVGELGPELFRDEIRRTDAILTEQSGTKPVGYRAPQWSLNQRTRWGWKILAEEGYRYDSSASPLAFVGDPRGRLTPHRLPEDAGNLLEIPPLVTPSIAGNLPTGGGWGFRFFPLSLIQRTIRKRNERGEPAVLFLHPRELDPGSPRLELPPLRSFIVYGKGDSRRRLELLLERFRFVPLKELADTWESA